MWHRRRSMAEKVVGVTRVRDSFKRMVEYVLNGNVVRITQRSKGVGVLIGYEDWQGLVERKNELLAEAKALAMEVADQRS